MTFTDHKPTDNIIRGALLIVVSVFMIAAMNALAKFLSGTHHPVEITFYRNIVILVGLAAWIVFSGRRDILVTHNLKDQVVRAVVGTSGVVLAFWAISRLPLADATTLLYTAPLFVTLLSYPFLGEKVGPFRTCAVLVGFGGIVVVAAPGGTGLPPDGIALGLAAAFFHALTQLQLRKLGRHENPLTTVFYFMLFGTILTGIAMPFIFTAPPTMEDFPLLLLIGAAGILQQVFKTYGYSMAPTAVVTPLNYFGLLWATLLGFLIWREIPGANVYLGAAIIISANLFILFREQYLKRKKGRERLEPSHPAQD